MAISAISLAFAAVVAGCAQPDPAPAQAVDPQAHARPAPEESDRIPSDAARGATGDILVVVVDEAIRPLPDAEVALDGGLARKAGQDGSVSFFDVSVGDHFLAATAPGHLQAQNLVEVGAGETTRIRVLLQAQPASQPTYVTQKFDGFAQATNAGTTGTIVSLALWLLTGDSGCERCVFRFTAEPGLNTTVVEATMDGNGFAGGGNGFGFALHGPDSWTSAMFERPNPMNEQVAMEGRLGEIELTMFVGSEPLPEISKTFQVFLTTFYGAAPPVGFSAID
jgi:hypothetical protein